jgi:hypothetical protein
MAYPQTGSTINVNNTVPSPATVITGASPSNVNSTGVNKTSTSLSTNILIMVGPNAVGAVQRMSVSEKRTIKQIDEVGTDGHIDSVPHASTAITGSCERIRFDAIRIASAFSRGFIHVSAQAYPFDIVIFDKQHGVQKSQITTVIKNVWINGIDYTYNAADWVIAETMTWEAETIFSFMGTGTQASTGGERGYPVSTVIIPTITAGNIEQMTDIGSSGRRGSLDASGIIDIASAW